MAISRMQMNRQLYAGGGIMDVTPREKFGLGSKLKKFVRKIIPNEVADIATKAAPFVAPFNPLLAAGMAGIGGFDQSGSISGALKSGALTYGLGNLARVVGGAGFQGGLKAPGTGTGFGSYFTSPMSGQQLFGGMPESAPVVSDAGFDQSLIGQTVGGADPGVFVEQLDLSQIPTKLSEQTKTDLFKNIIGTDTPLSERIGSIKELGGRALKAVYTDDKGKLDKNALFATISGVGTYIEAKKLADDAGVGDEYTEEMYEADKAKFAKQYSGLTPAAFGLKKGGRVKLEGGGIPSIKLEEKEDYNFMDLIDKEGEEDYYIKKAEELDRKYNPERYKQILPKEKPMDQYMLNEVMSERGMKTLSEETRDEAMKMYAERAFKKGQISEDEYREIMGFKKGGRIGFKDAGFITAEDLGIEKEKLGFPYDKSEYNLEDLGVERNMPKVLVMDEDGKTKIMDKKIAETLGLKIIVDSFDTDLIKKANGGRIGYKIGSKPDEDELGIMSVKMEMEDEDKEDMLMADAPGITFTNSEKSFLFKTLAGQGGSDRSFTMPQLYGIINNPNSDKNIGDAKALKAFLKMKGFKTGGRVQYAMGTEVPMRENQGGITELDYRNTGGFVPIGVKEKADDVPAMLSKNEFVFTADAVRAAGGGNINKGAKRMYDTMKALENKVV